MVLSCRILRSLFDFGVFEAKSCSLRANHTIPRGYWVMPAIQKVRKTCRLRLLTFWGSFYGPVMSYSTFIVWVWCFWHCLSLMLNRNRVLKDLSLKTGVLALEGQPRHHNSEFEVPNVSYSISFTVIRKFRDNQCHTDSHALNNTLKRWDP